jgi:HKD family nuclease
MSIQMACGTLLSSKEDTVELMNQPFTGQLGSRLIELLDSADYQTLNIVVAFAKNSGVLRIKGALERFRKRGSKVNVYVGVDLGGTSYEALTALLLHTDSLNVVHAEKWQTFHPKIYQFVGSDKGLVIVGSQNLTAGGLWTNFESSVLIPVLGSTASEMAIQKGVDDFISELRSLGDSFMPIAIQPDIDKLLENGYIFKEVAGQVRRAKASVKDGIHVPLFGNGAPATLPYVSTSKNVAVPSSPTVPIPVSRRDEDQTIWFETRAMTGGSRNILDLSMKSLVERGDPTGTSFDLETTGFMSGGVEFFGLNPTGIDETKDVSINFEGVDYTGNKILFPSGKSANGTWRLQIKGVTSSGEKITEAFRAKGEGYYMQYKIVTFTKVQDDYYFMSVFPESELENFKDASRILGRNGSTTSAKLFGLL